MKLELIIIWIEFVLKWCEAIFNSESNNLLHPQTNGKSGTIYAHTAHGKWSLCYFLHVFFCFEWNSSAFERSSYMFFYYQFANWVHVYSSICLLYTVDIVRIHWKQMAFGSDIESILLLYQNILLLITQYNNLSRNRLMVEVQIIGKKRKAKQSREQIAHACDFLYHYLCAYLWHFASIFKLIDNVNEHLLKILLFFPAICNNQHT